MKLWTYQEIIQKVKADLDLQEETFITPDEMVGYCNEGIHEAESEILKLNEDYFLNSAPLTLVAGTSQYNLPSGIYAQKVRGLQYANGSIIYPIKRIRGQSKFDILSMIQNFGPNDDYMYFPINPTAGVQSQILLAPTSRDSGAFVTIWYIRTANRIIQASECTPVILPTATNNATQLATVVDIPEFVFFIIDYMKLKCLLKDGDPRAADQLQVLANSKKMMVDTLTQQVPDDDDCIPLDLTFYREIS